MSKKSLILVVSLVLALTVGLGGTLAFLTDRDAETNVFTVGNVDIELEEDFEQGAALIPGVEIEKVPTIVNEGNNDAWVWMTWSIPAGLDQLIQGTEQGSNENPIHWNPLGATAEGYVTEARVQAAIEKGLLPEDITAEKILAENMTWNVFNSINVGENCYEEEINGELFNTYVLLYNKALTPGEETLPSVTKLFLDERVDIDPDGNMFFIENGNATDLKWNVNTNGAPVIHVAAYAIQKEGFETVNEAYAAYGNQWGDNGKAKYGTITVAEPASGATRPAGYVPAPTEGVIDNMIITDGSDDKTNLRALYNGEGGSANYLTEDLTIKNSYFDGTYAMNLYAVKDTGVELTVDGTTLAGWTSYTGFETATFTDCTFKANTNPEIYNVIRPYCETVFEGCEFSGTELWLDQLAGAKITLKDCTYNGKAITDASVFTVPQGDASSIVIE